jgi:hypothetical protein
VELEGLQRNWRQVSATQPAAGLTVVKVNHNLMIGAAVGALAMGAFKGAHAVGGASNGIVL